MPNGHDRDCRVVGAAYVIQPLASWWYPELHILKAGVLWTTTKLLCALFHPHKFSATAGTAGCTSRRHMPTGGVWQHASP